jgi:O-antigen ligase
MNIRTLYQIVRFPHRYPLGANFAAEEPPLLFYGLVVFFTLSFFTQLGVRLEFLGAVRHELLLGIGLLVVSAVVVASNPPKIGHEMVLIAALVLLVIVHVMAIPFAVVVSRAESGFMEYVLKHVLFCCFVVVLVRSPRQLLGLVATFVFALFWIYQEAVHGLITGSLVWRSQGVSRLHGGVTLYRHPNGLSMAGCMSVPFLFYAWPVFRRIFPLNLGLIVTTVLSGLCILYSGSRGGYVGLLALVPFWILDGPNKRRKLLIALVAAAVIVPLVPQQYVARFESITGEEIQGRSREARIQILYDAWDVFKAHPMGVGIGNFTIVRKHMFGRDQDTHNLYAQVATNLGIQGLVVFIVFIVAMFASLQGSLHRLQRTARMARKILKGDEDGTFARGFVGWKFEYDVVYATTKAVKMMLFFMLVNGLVSHSLYHIIWWLLAGVALSIGGISMQMEKAVYRCAARLRGREPARYGAPAQPRLVPSAGHR